MTALLGRKSSIAVWAAWPILVLLAGCAQQPKSANSLAGLEDRDPAVRFQAIKWAGENGVTAAVPLLVDRLLDQDQAVRFYAAKSLERITGETFGYDYKARPHRRAAAVARWRQFISQADTSPP